MQIHFLIEFSSDHNLNLDYSFGNSDAGKYPSFQSSFTFCQRMLIAVCPDGIDLAFNIVVSIASIFFIFRIHNL